MKLATSRGFLRCYEHLDYYAQQLLWKVAGGLALKGFPVEPQTIN
jgi:hypothetical protein